MVIVVEMVSLVCLDLRARKAATLLEHQAPMVFLAQKANVALLVYLDDQVTPDLKARKDILAYLAIEDCLACQASQVSKD